MKKLLTFLFLLCVFIHRSEAYPGTLSTSPLVVTAQAKPNIMFFIDNSGSMMNIVPDDPYNPATDGLTCASANRLTANSNDVDIRVTSGGVGYFNYNGTDFDWGSTGNANSNGSTGHKMRCFDPTGIFNGRLYGDSSSNPYVPGTYLDSAYTGQYLNWYFTSSGWGAGARSKPGTFRRMDIAKSSTISLLNSLSNVRVGLSTFDGTLGAQILVGVNDIASNLGTMTTQINALAPTGSTPLAAAMRDIGRYFVQGYNNNLTLHPGQSNQQKVSAYNVFDRIPTYSAGVSQISPIQYFCQNSFLVVMTDGRPQNDQVMNNYLADYDGDCVNATPACLTFDRKVGLQYESAGSDYMNDVADALNDIDLRPDLLDSSGNAVKKNIVTHAIGFADTQVVNDPLMQSTADEGGGLYLYAGNNAELSAALLQVFNNSISKLGAAANATFNSGSLQAGTSLFTTTFYTAGWTGELSSYALSATGQIGSLQWQASSKLDSKTPNNRVIFTYNRDLLQAVPFRTLGNLSILQQADLKYSGGTSALGQARLDYFRGTRTQEGGNSTYNFRIRSHLLGDIVDSSAVYVGAPSSDWPDLAPFPTGSSSKYSVFKQTYQNRQPVVYAGSNDGMLHAFNGSNVGGGDELFAFIPHEIFSSSASAGLHYFAEPTYGHLFYVDESPAIADAYVKTTPLGSASWHTILVGNLGRGGRGIFALDVTDPSAFTEANANNLFMWEFSDNETAELGYTLSDPTIALLNNGRWAAIFGNGYNSTGTGRASLFIVYLDGGLGGIFLPGIDYQIITTGVGSLAQPNGLSTPAVVDSDGNGTADRVYAGDLYGNLWVFDLSSSSPLSWGSAYSSSGTPVPLFKATDSGGTVQPITAKPIVSLHPTIATTGSNTPNVLVVFGTGQYLTYSDVSTTSTQSMYGVWDAKTSNLTRAKLVGQTLSAVSSTYRSLTDNSVPYTSSGSAQRFGWYIDLTSGERVVVPARIRNNIVFFNTMIPDSQPCGTGGTGWLMSVKLLNGGNPPNAVFDVDNSGSVDDNTDKVNGVFVAGQKITVGLPSSSGFRGNMQYTVQSNGSVQTRVIANSLAPITGRSAWHELRR